MHQKSPLSFCGSLPGNIILLEEGKMRDRRRVSPFWLCFTKGCSLPASGKEPCGGSGWLAAPWGGTFPVAVLFMTHEGICPYRPISSRATWEASAFSTSLVPFLWGAREGSGGSCTLIARSHQIPPGSNSDSVCISCQCSGHMSVDNLSIWARSLPLMILPASICPQGIKIKTRIGMEKNWLS
jgi:hypothetical protein